MMHKRRAHSRVEVPTAEDLAQKLTRNSWTLCSGFKYGDHLYLNDSTSEGGAQEYAVFRATPDENGEYEQIESITFGWMTEEDALKMIEAIASGQYGAPFAKYDLRQHCHGACVRCA